MSNILLDIKLHNNKILIPDLAEFLADSAYKLGLSKQKSSFLCFTLEAVLELRTDFISEDNPEVRLVVSDNGSTLKISVTDFGKPYILTKNQQAILKKGLVDRYSFEQLGRKGQCFSFSFKYEPLQAESVDIPKEEKLLDDNFTYGILPKEDEAVLEAIQCLYQSYGYDYYHQHLYSVENFKKYMEGGTYVPIVGKNEHGQVACYAALDENPWFKSVPEFGNLVTSPIARGRGLAGTIFKRSEEMGKNLGYEGIHVSAVAYHPYTQKMCNKLGYTPCSIEYSINPPGTGGYDKDRRLDCVLCVKIFNKEKRHVLYLSPEYEDLISDVFDEEKLNYEIINEGNFSDENLLTYFVDPDTGNCFMKIDSGNNEFEKEFTGLLEREEVQAMDLVTVNLNMNNESSISCCKILRSLGFICVGCLPGSLNGDYMILQKFKSAPLYDKIVLEENYSMLAEKVRKLNNI